MDPVTTCQYCCTFLFVPCFLFFNRPFSKMAAENSNRSILKTYTSTRVGCLLASLVSLEFSEKFPYFFSQSNECTPEFVWKRNSAICILGDVARFTKSVNFTCLITVGNNVILVRNKAKIRNCKIIIVLYYLNVPTPFHWQKVRKNNFWSRSWVDRF